MSDSAYTEFFRSQFQGYTEQGYSNFEFSVKDDNEHLATIFGESEQFPIHFVQFATERTEEQHFLQICNLITENLFQTTTSSKEMS